MASMRALHVAYDETARAYTKIRETANPPWQALQSTADDFNAAFAAVYQAQKTLVQAATVYVVDGGVAAYDALIAAALACHATDEEANDAT